ncbi:hypothetical protein [Yeosuana marina]|uniref:hypothetical protein n=1 Tax=Yeosuana marina TaxID=1565536 RepID=UPI0030C8D3A9
MIETLPWKVVGVKLLCSICSDKDIIMIQKNTNLALAAKDKIAESTFHLKERVANTASKQEQTLEEQLDTLESVFLF